MHSSFQSCRICRTERNLKYTATEIQQIFQQFKSPKNGKLLIGTPTLGNICHDCEERLLSFLHSDAEDTETETDVDVDGDVGQCAAVVLRRGCRPEAPQTGATVGQQRDELRYGVAGQQLGVGHKLQRRCHVHEHAAQRGSLLGSDGDGDGDGDTEIIEVLTSRESTPLPQSHATSGTSSGGEQQLPGSIIVGLSPHQVVIPITIETDDDEDDDVDNDNKFKSANASADNPKRNARKGKRCRKTYAEGELRLIATLSLVSSDSEAERDVKEAVRVELTPNQSSPPLDRSLAPLPTAAIEEELKCPVCQSALQDSHKLVVHMRRKHRSYEGGTLSERPRCAQDSAMTIRLRYRHRHTYYECQLCGRIDSVFKAHKEHVMQQHAAESKSLKDPMMMELKCPLCKEKCGPDYVQLCSHLLSSHDSDQYKPYLREITQIRPYNARKQKVIKRTARVFQLTRRKNYLYQCKMCTAVASSLHKHTEHVQKAHQLATGDALDLPAKHQPTLLRKANSRSAEEAQQPRLQRPKGAQPSEEGSAQATNGGLKRRRSRLSKKEVQSALIKVKVKAPLRQLAAHAYTCEYCEAAIKGFRRFNLHQLAAHPRDEFHSCSVCRRSFASEQHMARHLTAHGNPRRKRRYPDGGMKASCCRWRMLGDVVVQDDKGVRPEAVAEAVEEEEEAVVLLDENCNKDFQRLKSSLNGIKQSACESPALKEAQQCHYCTHLFASAGELNAHLLEHQQRQDIPCLRRHSPPARS